LGTGVPKTQGYPNHCDTADFKGGTDEPEDESDKDGGRKYGHPRLDNEKPFTESPKPEHLSLPLYRYVCQDVC